MPIVTYTNPNPNEIVFSAPSLRGVVTPRLGEAQKEFTTNTISLENDIFFKFYTCNDSLPGAKVYDPLNVSSAFAQTTIMERVATILFLAYYQNATLVSELSTNTGSITFSDLAERLNGIPTPSRNLSTTVSLGSRALSRFVEFVSMGLGSFVGAGLINANSAFDGADSPWGTRVAQVHLTTTNPLGPSPIEALYDNSDAGEWRFSDFNCQGVVVYTNLLGGAFSPSGLSVWIQLACVWPIIANLYSANFACMFNTLDASFMRNGLGFFDRASRRNLYYGWSGNFLQSVFNDWGIPIISPIWCISDMTLGTILYNTNPSYLPFELDDQNIEYRFVGPRAQQNISVIKEKTARSILPLLWTSANLGRSLAWLDFKAVSLGYANASAYISACLGSTSEGYNAHLYQSNLQSSYGGFPLTDVRNLILNGVTWSANLASQPNLINVFVSNTGVPYYYAPALGNFFPGGGTSYRHYLLQQIETYTTDMGATLELDVEAWVYTAPP
jgi:hypothetical protein